MTRLVLIHGWGFDRSVWQKLNQYLKVDDQDIVDMGFFGNEASVDCTDAVVIAHSYGVQHALGLGMSRARGLVAINGFARFTQAPEYPANPPRLLDRMIRRFDDAPLEVLGEFRRRCGAAQPWTGMADTARLRAGLLDLRDGDRRPDLTALSMPVLSLCGRLDTIVPPEMADSAFAGVGDLALEWRDDAGHLLPMTHPHWCAAAIGRFLDTRIVA